MPRLPCDFSIIDAFLEFVDAGFHCILPELRCDGKEFTTFLLRLGLIIHITLLDLVLSFFFFLIIYFKSGV